MKKITVAMLLCLISHQFLSASDDSTSHLKISIIIPCSYKHAEFLYPLLKMYTKQTVLPYEVIISLSEFHKAPLAAIKKIQYSRWPFRLRLLLSEYKQYAGTNRNIACECATGDVFVCQDSDDIPHPQRVEIIKYFFEHYDIDHLMHLYKFGEDLDHFPLLNRQHIDFSYNTDFENAWKENPEIHNGCPAITRAAFEKIQWHNEAHREDTDFNRDAYRSFNRCMIINAPLYIYRSELSTWVAGARFHPSLHTYWDDLYDTFLLGYSKESKQGTQQTSDDNA